MADVLLELAESDPLRCVEECQRLIESDDESDPVRAGAYRARGIALRDLGRVEESTSSLAEARRLYEELSMQRQADESAISLAASLAMSGDFKSALEMLEPICGSPDLLVRSHALVQRAGLVARSGEFEESLKLYAEAEPLLARNEDLRWLALMYSTRGLVQTYRNEFDAAENDLRSAKQLFESTGRHSTAAVMLGNIGFLYVVKGEIARGLETLIEAHDLHEKWGLPPDPVETAQAFGYMLAGMPQRAYQVLMSAARRLAKQGRPILRAEALIQAAKAAMAAGDAGAALESAGLALDIESLADRPGWRAIAELVLADATVALGGAYDPADLAELSERFLDWENLTGAAHSLTLSATVDIDAGHVDRALRTLERMTAINADLVELPVRIRAELAVARVSVASGDDEAARVRLRQAAAMIDGQRLLLGATESRAGLSRLQDDVVRMGLSLIPDGAGAIEWIDQFRASSLRMVPVVPNQDPEIASGIAELRRMSRERDEAVAGSGDHKEISEAVRRLEERIRDLILARPGDGTSRQAASMNEIRAALGDRTMLYFYERTGSLIASLVTAGSVTSEPVGEVEHLRRVAQHLLSALRRCFMYPEHSNPSRVSSGIEELGALFGLVPSSAGQVVVVPPPEFVGLPWNAIAAAAKGLSVVVAPSADAWARADRLELPSGEVRVVAGPRLEHARTEAGRVSAIYGDRARSLVDDQSSVESVLDAMRSCATFHAVAHGRLRSDNPMFSALELSDGDLNLYLLESLERSPSLVVLSACDSAQGNIVSGLEMFGLSSILLSRGSKSILSTVAPIPDSPASVAAAEAIHRNLRDGIGPAEALREVLADSTSPVDPIVAFVAYGAS